jgi:hypothetical protein
MDKILVCDNSNNLWVIGYIQGSYNNRKYMAFEDRQELEKMTHSFPI